MSQFHLTTPAVHKAPSEVPIVDVLQDRWSTRSFDAGYEIPEGDLFQIIEAARWAPSAFNSQPWEFLVARRGDPAFARIVAHLSGFNQSWAPRASALIVATTTPETQDGHVSGTADYDLGQAVAHATIQAQSIGLHTHQMSGIDAASLATEFGIESPRRVVTVIAVGKYDGANVPDDLVEREATPRSRKPHAELLIHA